METSFVGPAVAADVSCGISVSAIQTLMRPGDVIILVNVFTKQLIKMSLAAHNHVIESLASQRADESLDERVLPRTSIGGTHRLDPASLKQCTGTVAINAVVVVEQVPRLVAPSGWNGHSEFSAACLFLAHDFGDEVLDLFIPLWQ